MATIGSLAVNIVAVTDKFNAGINKALGTMDGFVKKVSIGAGAVTAAFGGMLRLFDSTGSQLHDMSTATGIAVEQLDFLKFAASQSGSSIDVVAGAARHLQQNGIDPNRFQQIAASIAAISDPTQRAQAAMEAFGTKAGSALLPMINELPQLQQEFEKLGGGMTTQMAAAADSLGDSLGKLQLAMRNIALAIANQLAPVVVQITEFVSRHIKTVNEWIALHPTLIRWIGGLALALTTVAPVLYGINTALAALRTGLMALAAVAAIAEKHPILLALTGAVLAGTAAYKYFSAPAAPAPAPTPQLPAQNANVTGKQTADNTKTQVQLTQEQNEILRQMAASQTQVQVAVAGVR